MIEALCRLARRGAPGCRVPPTGQGNPGLFAGSTEVARRCADSPFREPMPAFPLRLVGRLARVIALAERELR